MPLPALSTQEFLDLDQAIIDTHPTALLSLMEIAGYQVAQTIRSCFSPINNQSILVVAGSGHNGGDALVAARHLSNWGAAVTVCLASDRLKDITQHQWNWLADFNCELLPTIDPILSSNLSPYDLIVDGYLGIGFEGSLRDNAQTIINHLNTSKKPILAIDCPSGLNANTGSPQPIAITAHTTVTFTTLKKGFLVPEAASYLGTVYIANVGLPKDRFFTGKTYPFYTQDLHHWRIDESAT